MAASKVAGATAGVVIGGALGSVIPVAGTVVGGMIGGIIGGVLVDAALLKLEEIISREEFKREIIAAIRDTKAEFNLNSSAALTHRRAYPWLQYLT